MLSVGIYAGHTISSGLGVSFLIETKRGLYLIDSGSPGQQGRVLAKMRQLRRTDLKLIWITHAHYDHYGSAGALRDLTGAPIGVHPADAASMLAGLSPLDTFRSYGFIYPPAQRVMAVSILNATRPISCSRRQPEQFAWKPPLHTPGHTPGIPAFTERGSIDFAAT